MGFSFRGFYLKMSNNTLNQIDKKGLLPLKVQICEAFSLIYDIETTLRKIVNKSMTEWYGYHWRTRLRETTDLKKYYFHDLIALLFRYPLAFQQFQNRKVSINRLIHIRNLTCHMRALSDDDFRLLKECHEFICKEKSPLLSRQLSD